MNTVEVSGKTVDEAIQAGLDKLDASRDQVEVEILEEPSKGFLGIIGGKDALVRITKKISPSEIAENALNPIFASLSIKPKVESELDGDQLRLFLTGDDLGILIGRRGDTLDALQYWTNLAVNRKADERIKVILDVEGYRDRREKTLINLAKRLGNKVKKTNRKVVLEPMNPFERRIIHTALQGDKYVQTFSEGEEPYRKVVIALRK